MYEYETEDLSSGDVQNVNSLDVYICDAFYKLNPSAWSFLEM